MGKRELCDEFLHLRYGGNRTRAEQTSKSHKVFDLKHSADRVYTIGTEGSHHMWWEHSVPFVYTRLVDGYSCIFLFLVWFFLRPISPKEDTTHHLKPIVEAREYVYFLYICIHTLTSRSLLVLVRLSEHFYVLTTYTHTSRHTRRAGGCHQNIGHVSPRTCSLEIVHMLVYVPL